MSEPSRVEVRPSTHNNFDGLRLVGALMVLIGHAFVLTGRGDQVPSLLGFHVHVLGVYIFFSISGYLIAASWARSRNLWTYATARVLRIFPALILLIAVTVLLIGPIATTLPPGDYFTDSHTWSYLDNARLWIVQYALPGVFADTTYPTVINGSLWSLPFEFGCYLVVPVALVMRNRWVSIAAVAGLLTSAVVLTTRPAGSLPTLYGQPLGLGHSFLACFAAGSLIFLLRGRWPGLLRLDVAALLVVAYVIALDTTPRHVESYSWAVLPYAVLTLGFRSWPVLRDAARFGDMSYGLYLWAFPVQQLIIWQWGDLPLWFDIPLVTVLTAALAYASWHGLERHALRLAKRIG